MAEASWRVVGRVTAVDAAKRALRVAPSPGSARFFDGCDLLRLQRDAGAPVQLRVAAVRDAGNLKVVVLTPGVSRDATATMKNAEVLLPVSEADADNTPRGFIGMRVETAGGVALGVIFEMMENSVGGAIRLARSDGSTAALPLTPALICRVDRAAGVMVVVDDVTPFIVLDDTKDD